MWSVLTPVDIGIVLGYFVFVFIVGMTINRERDSASGYFLAGRTLGWSAIGFSLFSSNISSASIVGLTGLAYSSGISISAYEWMATLVLIFVAIFMVPVYLGQKITTVPEYLEKRFGPSSRRFYSLLTIILTLLVDVAASMYAGGLVMNAFFPLLSIWETCIIVAVLSGIYTTLGGLAAVVYTDILQSVLLLVGSTLVLIAVLSIFDFDLRAAIDAVGGFEMFPAVDDPVLPGPGILVGVPILGFYYWATNQYVVQRILGARDQKQARYGALFGGFLKLAVVFLIVFPGILGQAIYPSLDNGDELYTKMLFDLVPPGVMGLVIAGLVAAIMSSVDSALHSSSTLIVIDFIDKDERLTGSRLTRVGRLVTVILILFAAVWSPFIGYFEGLFSYLQQILCYSVPPVSALFLMGLFTRRGGGLTANITLSGGLFSGLLLGLLNYCGCIQLHYTYVAFLIFVISVALFYAASLLDQERRLAELDGLTWRGETFITEIRTWDRYFVPVVILLVGITFWIIFIFS